MRYNCYRVLFRPAHLVQICGCNYARFPLCLILHFSMACSEGGEHIITLHQSPNLKLLQTTFTRFLYTLFHSVFSRVTRPIWTAFISWWNFLQLNELYNLWQLSVCLVTHLLPLAGRDSAEAIYSCFCTVAYVNFLVNMDPNLMLCVMCLYIVIH